jgi:hypothetical protein
MNAHRLSSRLRDWIAAIAIRVLVPADHRKKFIALGYVRETESGFEVTELGLRRLEQERKAAIGFTVRAPRRP